jgi:antitoxin component YwqK of YwqJK toxin-antitoxin module
MRTSCILFLVIIPFIVFGQVRDEEKERQRIAESKIKTVIQWTHRYTQGKPNPTGYKTSETNYDKRGNPTEIINYRANGEISSRLLYKYNDQNLKTEYIMYQKVDKPELQVSYKQTFHYNNKGQKTHEIVFDGGAGYRIVNNYFPNDQLKEIVKYGTGNKIEEKWEYSYTDNSHEIRIFIPDNNLSTIVRKKFDPKGNQIEEIRFDAKGNELKKTTFAYDSKSRLIEMAEYFSGNLTKKLHYKFNNLDLVEEILQENSDGKKFTQATYSYDPKGNLLEEKWSEDNASEFSHKQSRYDRDGNLIEVDSYFAPYRYRVFYKYTYDYHK